MFQQKLEKGLSLFYHFLLPGIFFFMTSPLYAAKDKGESEPVWIASWAMLLVIIIGSVFLLSLSAHRVDSVLDVEEKRNVEAMKIEKQKKLKLQQQQNKNRKR